MSRKLAATICLSTALVAADTAAAAMEFTALVIPGDRSVVETDRPGPPMRPDDETTPVWTANLRSLQRDDGIGLSAPTGNAVAEYRGLAAEGRYAGAGAALDFELDDFAVGAAGGASATERSSAGYATGRERAFAVSLNGVAGIESGPVSVGPFAGLRYTRSAGGAADPYQDSLIGQLGLQAAARFDTRAGAVDTRLRMTLARDLDGDDDTADRRPGPAYSNLTFEEVDATPFQLENAVSLTIGGDYRGLFEYETKVQVRLSGIREVSARIKVDF